MPSTGPNPCQKHASWQVGPQIQKSPLRLKMPTLANPRLPNLRPPSPPHYLNTQNRKIGRPFATLVHPCVPTHALATSLRQQKHRHTTPPMPQTTRHHQYLGAKSLPLL